MIKKLKVKNFRSLKDFEIEFGKFNVLVGKNASGKSNILDCLNFLREVIEVSLARAIENRRVYRGYEDIVYSSDSDNIISVEVEVEIDGKNVLYHISFSGKYGIIGVNEAYIKIDEHVIKITATADNPIYPPIGKYESSDEVKGYGGLLASFKKYMTSITQYQWDIENIKKRVLSSYEKYTLDKSGWDLVQVLDTLYVMYGEIYAKISENFSDIYPGNEVCLIPKESVKLIGIKEKIGENKIVIPSMNLSEGMIKVLCVLTTLFTVQFFEKEHNIEMPLFCFEEIENHLYPDTIWKILDLMKNSDAQIILTTHSSYLLNHLEPEDIIIVKKELDGTKAIKNADKMRKLMQKYEFKLGELWAIGEFDDFEK